MSTENIDRRLHRLHDGDLSASEREALEKEIAAEPTLQRKLEGLREVGVAVRAARTDDAPIDSDALWSAIEARISTTAVAAKDTTSQTEREAPAARPALRAIPGGAGREAPKGVPVEDARARRRRWIGIGVGALAIAAAALFVVFGPPDDGGSGDTVADGTPAPAPTEAPSQITSPAPTDDVPGEEVAAATDYTEVLAVDFGMNVGTIFAVEGEGGQRYAVVWLDDVLKDDGALPEEAPSTPD